MYSSPEMLQITIQYNTVDQSSVEEANNCSDRQLTVCMDAEINHHVHLNFATGLCPEPGKFGPLNRASCDTNPSMDALPAIRT